MSAVGAWDRYARTRNLSRNRLLRGHHAEMVEAFLREFAALPTDRKVLDIGPANGVFLVLLRELGFRDIEGLEIAEGFVACLREKGLRATQGDIVTGSGLDRLSPPYDAVILMEVLEHLEDPRACLANVRRLIADDGLLYLTVPIRDCVFDRLSRFATGVSRREQVLALDETHLHAFSRGSLERLLEGAGFGVRRARRESFMFPRSRLFQTNRVQMLVRALLPRRLHGLCLSVVARPRAATGGR